MNNPETVSIYDRLGGDEIVKQIVDTFYDYMDNLDEAKQIRDLHPKDLRGSRKKLYMFLSGWLGGPSLYIEAFGHPRLRARHFPFPIGETERDQWMLCMTKAFHDIEMDNLLRDHLLASLTRTADHMINQ